MDKTTDIQCVLLKLFKLSHRNALIIAKLIIAVVSGLKIGFIWDIGPPVAVKKVREFVTQLEEMNFTNCLIICVQIKDDICILNKEKFLEQNIDPIFIDVSKDLEKPQLILSLDKNILEMLHDIRKQIELAQDFVTLNVNENEICIPSIIGILAGFPIIYWYDPSKGDNNCLSDVDLIICKVYQENQVISSFSCPKYLFNTPVVENKIKFWRNTINNFKDYQIKIIDGNNRNSSIIL